MSTSLPALSRDPARRKWAPRLKSEPAYRAGRLQFLSCQTNEMTRDSLVPYPRALHSQVLQSCSPKTRWVFSGSSSIARSGVLFGSGRLTVFMPDQPQQSQCVSSECAIPGLAR